MSQPNDSQESLQGERVVTDAIFSRMRDDLVVIFCEECKVSINNDPADIEKHFHPNHRSSSRCIYCREKVFRYIYHHGNSNAEEVIYHECGRRTDKSNGSNNI